MNFCLSSMDVAIHPKHIRTSTSCQHYLLTDAKSNAALPAHIKHFFLDIESWTTEPITSAVLPGLKLTLNEAKELGIPEKEVYERSYGSVQTRIFDLTEFRKIEIDGKTFLIASYKDANGLNLFSLYALDGNTLKKLKTNSLDEGFQHKVDLVKLGDGVPPQITIRPLDIFKDACFYTILPDYRLEKVLYLDLYGGGLWLKDVDGDGDIEVVLFNDAEAPAGIQKILEENDLELHMLYVPRITIYKWKHNGFIKLAVKYYSKHDDLPNGLIKDAVTKIYQQ
jgi:hypothetical protein